MTEIFFSIDVEANGPIPGPNAMWSLGAVAFLDIGTIVGRFSDNLQDLEGSVGGTATLKWWEEQPEAYHGRL